MITNFSLNDNTQKEILKHLEITSKLLSKVGTKLSETQKESIIFAMPDLGIAQNGTRMLGGFYTGACYSWDSDVPFIPVDATVNVCGTTVYRLKHKISVQEFKNKLDNVIANRETYLKYATTHLPSQILDSIDLERADKFYWNYNVGNHFAILAEQNGENSEFPEGQYMIVHASAIELKKDNLSHYGMPTDNAVCIGCQWEQDDFTLLTAPGNDIYLVHPNLSSKNTIKLKDKQITLTPHGCGVMLKNSSDTIEYLDDGIRIGNKHLKKGESINIGNDAAVRTNGMYQQQVKQHIDKVLSRCPGTVYGQMHQLFARTKYGDFDYSKKDLEK